jgi:hypothetical protein
MRLLENCVDPYLSELPDWAIRRCKIVLGDGELREQYECSKQDERHDTESAARDYIVSVLLSS